MSNDTRKQVRGLGRVLDLSDSVDLTDEEVRAELANEGVDAEAFVKRGLARIAAAQKAARLASWQPAAREKAAAFRGRGPARDRSGLPFSALVAEEPWTYLRPAEQLRVIAAFHDEEDRDIVAFAIGSGLRAGELVSLELDDVRLGAAPQIVVRFGGQRHAPTKNRKTRVVPLFGLALAAVRRQVERLRSGQRNDRGLLWPNQVGSWRPRSHVLGHVGHRRKPHRTSVGRWQHVVRALDLGRPVRWHDLRHTCASSLVAGWWGRAWRLEEVRDLLGHSSVDQTEIYAHLATSVLSDAAETTGIEAPDVGFPRSPREAHAHENAANMLAIAMPSASSMERVNPSDLADFGAPVGFAWGSPALRDLVVDALGACAEQRSGAVERAREAVRAVVAARVAADPVLAAARTAETRGVAGLVEVLSQALRELSGAAARRGRR